MGSKSVQEKGLKSAHEPDTAKRAKYARVPVTVLFDKELTPAAVCVYAVLARWVFQGSVANMGKRKIAKDLGYGLSTVKIALKLLSARGHVVISGEGRQRRFYHLTSPVFAQKQRALNAGESTSEELVSGPRPRLATVRTA